jgi:uncharacterized membrane protein YphA (DoxX/SURF4 family)
MNSDIFFLIGQILFGGYFVMNGLNHLVFQTTGLTGYAASRKVPYPKFAVYGTGLLIFLGGLGILFGVYIEWSVALIAIFLIGVTFKMHSFWKDADPMMKMTNQVNFTKNLALLGAALMFLTIPTPWPFSVGF